MSDGGPLRREVVSFARRDGRASRRHRQAWDAAHAEFVVVPERAGRSTSLAPGWRLDPVAVFGRLAPLVVEIGSGTGDAVLAAARERPDVDHLAVEVYRPGVARTVVVAAREGLGNLRVVEADGAALLRGGLPEGGVDEVRVFFPDPWPKARHHKRRLVTADLLEGVAGVLRPGGVVRLATDWGDYALAMRAAAARVPALVNPHAPGGGDPADEGWGWAPRFAQRPPTRFERKGTEAGRVVRDLELVRRERVEGAGGGRPARR